jgi:transglutaminase-like putative cysteine protease
MSKRSGTDGSLLASLPWTLAALAFSVVPHIQFLPVWATTAFLTCSAWRWQVERKRWRLPPAWLRIVLSLICFIGVMASYDSISGVGPGSALLTVMAALKMLETKRRRDQFVLLFISIFLIMSSLLREQYLWSLPYLAAGVVLTMTAWLRMSTSSHVSAAESFKTAVRLIAYAAPLTAAMWIFFPRIATPFWAVPIDTSSASSGLSEQMSPGDISSLSQSNAVAFRVKFEGAVPPPHQRYWRALVLHRFNGRTWSGSNDPSIGSGARSEVDYLGDPLRYQVTMEATRQHWVFALDIPYEWDLDRTFMGRQQQLARVQPIDQRIAYTVTSHPRFRLNSDLKEFWRSRYTDLPENRNLRTLELSRRMRDEAPDDEAFITNVLEKFNNEEFFYTLDPPALGSNPVDRFLFDTRRGFCEHYASAFAVMMRAVGIPSRVVLGYQGGEMNPMGDYMIVRQADAHAWTEAWLPGRGWYRIDPTAAVAPERIESGRSGAMFDGIAASWGLSAPSQLLYQLTLTWDVLNAKWNDWILGYGPENQSKFMEWLGMEDPDWRQMMLTLIAIVTILVAIISVLLLLRYRPPPKDAAAILYRKFTEKAGIPPSRGETPLSYALRLAEKQVAMAGDAESITTQYLDARYGPPDLVAIENLKEAVYNFSRRR